MERAMNASWESELGQLLRDLSTAQQELLDVLAEKRRCLAEFDVPGIAALAPREHELSERLAACQQRRLAILAGAAQRGLPAESLRSLVASLPRGDRQPLVQETREATLRARLLAHQSLANWVVVQRTILHLSQLLEIIATGGRLQPTYGKESASAASGSFVDQAA
jgi:hypothetical protein